jgi:O-antigen/teichoic acid export membrane protein
MSRTSKGLLNSIVSIVFTTLSLCLSFISRKYFLDYLGTEVLGLNTTATNLLQFLNIAELGIGSAVSFSLYKPLHNRDYNTINEIVYLQKYLYRRIALIVIFGAVILMAFFPLIFKKMELPLWYAYGSFSVLLLSSMLGYFVNYKQIVLIASQLEYKITIYTKSWNIVKVILQIIAICNFLNPYIWWLVLEGIFAIILSITIDFITRREFPHFSKVKLSYKRLSEKYNVLFTKVKQLFFHRISGFVLTQTSGVIIYGFLSLTMVSYYGNYYALIGNLQSLLNNAFNSMNAGVGDLVAEGNRKQILSVFNELFSLKFYIIIIACFSAFIGASPFITLWIGEEYLLPQSTVFIMVLSLYVLVSRTTVDSYINAYGLFHDIWAPIIEALVNISASVGLGFLFGLNGILSGPLVSMGLVVLLWKPYFLFTRGLKEDCRSYVYMYIIHIIVLGVSILLWHFMMNLFPIFKIESWISLILYLLINISIFSAILLIIMLIFKCDINKSLTRILRKVSAQNRSLTK